MDKEGFSKLIVMMIAAVLVVGIAGYYLGSVSNEEAEDNENVIAPENNAVVPEDKPAETTPPVAEVASVPMKEWVVEIAAAGFVPANLTISKGDKVTWINKGWASHTIEADGIQFISRPLETNDSYSVILSQVGTYGYHCKIHPAEKGEIVVE